MKEIVKDLEQAIFGDDDNDDNDDNNDGEKLYRRFKNLISKKRRELLREYLKESEDANPRDRVNALRKKLNNLPKTSSDNNYDSEDNQISNFVDRVPKKVNKEIVNDDSDDNQISNFVDKVLKKVSKEIANDDNNDNNDNNNDSKDKVLKKVSKEIANDDNNDNNNDSKDKVP